VWGVGGGGVGVARGAGRCGSAGLNVRSPVLLDLYLRFCILAAVLMYF